MIRTPSLQARVSPLLTKYRRRLPGKRITCRGGPIAGASLALQTGSTLPFTLYGSTGLYEHGQWKGV